MSHLKIFFHHLKTISVHMLYRIDQKESAQHQLLAIRLMESFKASVRPLTLTILRQTAPTDQELITLLIKEELKFQNKTVIPSFNLVHISQNHVLPALKLLAATQRLYFNDKQLVVDLFTNVDCYYIVESISSQTIAVKGRLKWHDKDIAVEECDFIGPGKQPWFIKGFSLKLVHTEISFKNLNLLHQKSPLILEGGQKTAFLEDIDQNDTELPRVIFIGEPSQITTQPSEPLPILQLRDNRGAFADLCMNYGNENLCAIHDQNSSFKRNHEAENNWEKDLLETGFIKKIVGSSHYYCPMDKVAKSLTFLLEIGWQIKDCKNNLVCRQGEMSLNLDHSQEHVVIKGKIDYDDYEVDLTDVIGSFNRRERFVKIEPGKVGLLPDDWEQSQIQSIMEEGEIVGKEIQLKKSRIGSLAPLFSEVQIAPSLKHMTERLKDFTKIEEALPGKDFAGTLREYQQQGLNWLSFLTKYGFHGILADDMGLGKTVQVLALLSRLPKNRPHLIVMPTSLLFNWKKEIEKFLPQVNATLHHGPQRAKTISELASQPIILTSYTTLRIDLPLLKNIHYGCLILDEAQAIKNAHTQTAQVACNLQSEMRLSITGTPLENHLNELWSHFHFLIPDLFGDEESFMTDLQAAAADGRYLQRIKTKVAPFILRRKKADVAKDLPERIDQTVWIEMGEQQRRLYDQFLSGYRHNLLKKVELGGVKKYRMEIFEAILRLRQICCHPLLVSSIQDPSDEIPDSAKLDSLLQDLETAVDEGKKVLIYSQFTSMLKLMTQQAKAKGWKFAYLDGSTTNREEVVNSFQSDPTIPLFFISLKAGGVGLNLTAADYVFLYDPWWNEAVEEQAINRAHRIGRKDTVIAKRFVMIESIEEKMMKLKTGKRLLIEELFDETSIASELSLEDLKYLLDI